MYKLKFCDSPCADPKIGYQGGSIKIDDLLAEHTTTMIHAHMPQSWAGRRSKSVGWL